MVEVDQRTDICPLYVIVRSEPSTVLADGSMAPGWEVLSSVLLTDLDDAREFAGKLKGAQVYRLTPVD